MCMDLNNNKEFKKLCNDIRLELQEVIPECFYKKSTPNPEGLENYKDYLIKQTAIDILSQLKVTCETSSICYQAIEYVEKLVKQDIEV